MSEDDKAHFIGYRVQFRPFAMPKRRWWKPRFVQRWQLRNKLKINYAGTEPIKQPSKNEQTDD
jgi:hypothetical protein